MAAISCNCSTYQPISFDRKSINKRIRESKKIQQTLELLRENTELRLKLFKCANCQEFWQRGHEWGFKDQEYLFQVPTLNQEEWLKEPYMQPAAMMLYTTQMQNYMEQNSFEESTSICRIEDCRQKAVKLSAFCLSHHIQQLQQARMLPKRPPDRTFPPYS